MSKRADYALIALSHLATAASTDPMKLCNTKEIAEQYEIPVELLAKLLQILAKKGLIASHPGPTGGYKLARQAKEISVAEVVMLIDGDLSILHCYDDQGATTCKQYSHCTIRDPLVEIEERVKQLLQNISIEEISGPPKPQLPDFSQRTFAAALNVGS
jgi:Rrf2 family protein